MRNAYNLSRHRKLALLWTAGRVMFHVENHEVLKDDT